MSGVLLYCAGILEQSMRARNREGIGLSYRPARLQRLAESIPGLLKSFKIGLWISCERFLPALFLVPSDEKLDYDSIGSVKYV